MIQINRLLRASVGLVTSVIPSRCGKHQMVYINLQGVNQIGGPDRFLRNFVAILQEEGISISNWSLKGCNAALVFSASWGGSFTWLCRKLGVRSVLRVDGFYVPEIFGDGKKFPLTDLQRWVNERLATDLENFDHVIYQSAFSKEQADLHLYKRRKAFSIIHNGVDTVFFKPGKKAEGHRFPTLIVLGKHYPEHLMLALDVFERIRAAQDARLLIVGPMRNDGLGQVSDFVAEYLGNSPLNEVIRCFGIVSYEDLPRTLALADIFLHVKVGDWCPNAVTEALACGLPVVCPGWGGTKELVKEGGIAVEGLPWMVDDNLRDGMAKAVLEILPQIEDYKNTALHIARQQYAHHLIAGKYLDVMQKGIC